MSSSTRPRITVPEARSSAPPAPPPAKCVILVPVARYIEPPCEEGLKALERAGYPVRRISGHSDIARGRSVIATEALADGFEELMWIDSDIVFTVADVARLRAQRLPIVGGIYALKGKPRLALTITGERQTLMLGVGGGLVEVKHLGTGFLLTRRAVYDRIRERHALPLCRGEKACGVVPYFLSLIVEEDGEKSYLSEDFSFCWRARAAGITVMADTTIRLGHVGSYAYSWEDAAGGVKRLPSYRMTISGPARPAPDSAREPREEGEGET